MYSSPTSLVSVFDWVEFKARVIAMYPNFFDNLADAHGNLSSPDIKLCALILMECSTQQCTQLLGKKTARAMQAARNRLGKKLGLPSYSKIHDHLLHIARDSATSVDVLLGGGSNFLEFLWAPLDFAIWSPYIAPKLMGTYFSFELGVLSYG